MKILIWSRQFCVCRFFVLCKIAYSGKNWKRRCSLKIREKYLSFRNLAFATAKATRGLIPSISSILLQYLLPTFCVGQRYIDMQYLYELFRQDQIPSHLFHVLEEVVKIRIYIVPKNRNNISDAFVMILTKVPIHSQR